MKKHVTLICVFLLSFSVTPAKAVSFVETPHYNVVAEYIRSLGAIHGIQRVATVQLQEDLRSENPSAAKLMSGIRNGTRTILELRNSIATLEKMSLGKPFETLLPTTIEFYKRRRSRLQEGNRSMGRGEGKFQGARKRAGS